MSSPAPIDPTPDEDVADDVSTHDTLRQIKAGTLTGKSLSALHRRACVDHLVLEGMSNTDIAAILSVSVRSVERDRQQLRKDYKLRVDQDFVDVMLGLLVRDAELAIARLRRIACEKDVSAGERRQAIFDTWRVRCELIEGLQSSGLLPKAESRLKAQVSLSPVQSLTPEELVTELTALARACGSPSVLATMQSAAQRQVASDPS